jgi:guanidinoacetate N-methyltransferase
VYQLRKTEEFLAQFPDWESVYKTSDVMYIDYHQSDWPTAPAKYSDEELRILGHIVMQRWETPYMQELARIASSKGGTVLELGFGMGISAAFIQSCNIGRHIIIEANSEVAQMARDFAREALRFVEVLEGLWEDHINQIPDGSLDGILFDTYPLQETELYQNHFSFFPYAYAKLRKGGIFTYYSDEISGFSQIHLKKLIQAGFNESNIGRTIVEVDPPEDCDYWQARTILAPIVVK